MIDTMDKKINVLIVEDSDDDAMLLLRELRRNNFDPTFKQVETAEEMNRALSEKSWDIVISDYSMPHFTGMEALSLLKKSKMDIPFILTSGKIGEETAVAAMRAGAQDYMMKDNLIRLGPSIERELREALSRKEKRIADNELKKLSAAIEQSVNIVFICDIKGTIEYVNPNFEEVTGYTKEEAIGQTPKLFSSIDTPRSVYGELWNAILTGNTWKGTFKNKRKDGKPFWVSSTIAPFRDDSGKITHFLSVQEDITERMHSEETIYYLKTHDELTGLANRNKMVEAMGDWMQYSKDTQSHASVIIVDIGDFETINNAYGRFSGDRLLKELGKIIKKAVEDLNEVNVFGSAAEDVIARLSSDEISVFLPNKDLSVAITLAEEILTSVKAFEPIDIPTGISINIGIALYPEHALTPMDILIKADAAVFRAKELGKDRFHIYNPSNKGLHVANQRLAWKRHIEQALKEDRFVPFYQPLMCVKSGQIKHYEALARMHDGNGKILLPGMFLDVAENFSLIDSIDKVMIEKTLILQSTFSDNYNGTCPSFAMNISATCFGDDSLLAFIESKISEVGADPKKLIFEITETATLGDMRSATHFIDSLRSLGCRFAIDDFGVGFTSFAYLKEMNIDMIKIDGSFIRRLHENKKDQLLVKAMVDVAQGLGIETVAEYVECHETLDLLRDYGIDFAQGHLIGKPAESPMIMENDKIGTII